MTVLESFFPYVYSIVVFLLTSIVYDNLCFALCFVNSMLANVCVSFGLMTFFFLAPSLHHAGFVILFAYSIKLNQIKYQPLISLSQNTGGHWYGRVTPCHVPLVIDKHILEGTIIRPLYRGCMPQQQQQQQSSISSIAKNSENDKHGGIVAALAAEETLAVAAARREKEGGGAESNKETRANLQW